MHALGPTEVLSGGWVFHLPLFALGFHPLAVGGMLAASGVPWPGMSGARSWREKLRQLFGRPAESLASTLDWGKPA
jgi:hypothetical protein